MLLIRQSGFKITRTLVVRVLLLLFAALMAVLPAMLTGARLFGGASRTPIPQLAAFAPWATIGWTLVLLVLLFGRWWWVAVLAGVLLLVQIWWVLPTSGAGAAAGARPGAIAVRVMTLNVKVGGADVGQVVRLAQDHNVDLLVIEEGQPPLVDALQAALGHQLPNVIQSNGSPAGTVIWSRWPIHQVGNAVGRFREIAQLQIDVPSAVPVTVTAVHTVSPGRGRIDAWNADLRTLKGLSEQTKGAQIMIGDFNASRDHAPFRALLGTGFVDSAEAVRMTPWSGVTWPTDFRHFPVAVRLDHVLVTPGAIGVRKVYVRTVSGTDHRAVLADLTFARAG